MKKLLAWLLSGLFIILAVPTGLMVVFEGVLWDAIKWLEKDQQT